MTTPLRRFGPDLGLLCASVIAAASVGRLFAGGAWAHPLGPLVATAAVGSAVPSLMAFRRVPAPIQAIGGTIAVMLVGLWTTVAGSTTYGLPTPHTWHVVELRLRAARPLLAQFLIPLHPMTGVVLLGAWTAGVVAVLASVLLHSSEDADRLRPGLALLGPFALLVFVCSRTVSPSLAVPVVLFLAAAALTVTTAQARPIRGTAGAGARRPSTTALLTVCTMAGVTVAALAVGSGAGGAGAGATPLVPPTAISLTSNLVELEVNDANVVLFHAHSPVRTYWQVAVLNAFRDGTWVPDSETQAAAQGTPGSGVPAPPAAGGAPVHVFSAVVQIDDLSSRLLPVPPSTLALTGAAAAVTDVGAVSSAPTTSGQQYTTISAFPTSDPGQAAGTASVATYPPALVRAETALPPLPSSVGVLARAATVGALNPVGQAEALVNWFRSGRFTYTLTPPATAPGSNPLVSFLTQTHAGDCEQFAGAYAVLARSLGLPTRVVVGFTAGRYAGPGEVTVKGADAHAWPQVYLGPTAGWVSFEPTPQQPRGELAPEGVVGPSGVQTAPPPTVGPPPTLPSRSTLPTTPATSVSQTTLPSVTAAAPGLGGLWWTLIGIGTLLVVALVAIALVRRRRRSPAGRTPGQVALLAQSEVRRAFHAAGFECPSWQPLSLFIESLSAPPHGGGSAPSAVREQCDSLIADGVTVAQAADAALFDPIPTDETGSRAAYDAATRVRQGLRDEEVRRGLFSDRAVDTRV